MTTTAIAAEDTEPPEFDINIKTDGNQANVYGDVDDVAPDNVSSSGVDRVELKFDTDSWVTADLSDGEYSYTKELEESGYHSLQIRAYDNDGNYDTVVKTYTASFDSGSDSSLTTKDYISIKSAKFITFDSYGFVSEVEQNTDVAVSFEIRNDADKDIRIRSTVAASTGFYEDEDDLTVQSGDSEKQEFWIPANTLKKGSNRFEIEIMDLSTREKLDDKTLTLQVTESTTDDGTSGTQNDPEEIPAWFVAIAEENDMKLPGDEDNSELQAEIESLNSTVVDQQDKISKLEADISRLNNQNNPAQSTSDSGDDDQIIAGIDNMLLYIAAAGLLYWKREYIQDIISGDSDDDISDEELNNMMPPEPPKPQ
jgi:hypothetical protein